MEHYIGQLHSDTGKCDDDDPVFSINDIQDKYMKETGPGMHAKSFTYGRECNEQQMKHPNHSLHNDQNGTDVSLKCFSVNDSLKSKPSSAKSVAPEVVYTSTVVSSNLGHSASKLVASEGTSVDESCKFLQNSNDNSPKYFAVPLPGESSKSNLSVRDWNNHWCKICRKGFESQEKYRMHATIHSKKRENDTSRFRYTKVLSCTECGKVFRSYNVLTKHFASNHSEGQLHLCKNCGKAFKSLELLSSHLAEHCSVSEKRAFLCDICGKAFKFWFKLKLHLAFHSEERPFVCDICGKGFKIRTHLTTHLHRHSKEFPYSCDVCKKVFKVKCNLTNHLAIHKEGRPYVCDLCGKGFKLKATLQKHQNLLVHLKGCERAINAEKLSGECTS